MPFIYHDRAVLLGWYLTFLDGSNHRLHLPVKICCTARNHIYMIHTQLLSTPIMEMIHLYLRTQTFARHHGKSF